MGFFCCILMIGTVSIFRKRFKSGAKRSDFLTHLSVVFAREKCVGFVFMKLTCNLKQT